MSKIHFKVAGNKTLSNQLNNNAFLTSDDRLKSGVDFGKSYYNDTSTYISIPSAFYREHFKYCRSSGIYRTSLQWKHLIEFMQVEQFTSGGYVAIKTDDKWSKV